MLLAHEAAAFFGLLPSSAAAPAAAGASGGGPAAEPGARQPASSEEIVATILEAITAPACGEPISYERFEVLGDAFLKFAAASCVFLREPEYHEGELTAAAGRMTSNRALVRVCRASGLDRRAPARMLR